MEFLIQDLIDEVDSCSSQNLPHLFKETLQLIEVDDQRLCDKLGITIYDLENILDDNFTIKHIDLIRIKMRLCSLLNYHLKQYI